MVEQVAHEWAVRDTMHDKLLTGDGSYGETRAEAEELAEQLNREDPVMRLAEMTLRANSAAMLLDIADLLHERHQLGEVLDAVAERQKTDRTIFVAGGLHLPPVPQ